jgi:predicted Zn finger-like uncharacterized protein
MKFLCDQCDAQYMIADSKVGPRGVKVKCKKCDHVIVVNHPAAGDTSVSSVSPSPKDSPAADIDKLFDAAAAPAAALPAGAGDAGSTAWYLAVGDSQVGPIDLSEVKARFSSGGAGPDTLVWRAGMTDWLALDSVAELQHLVVGAAAPATGEPLKQSAAAGSTAASGASAETPAGATSEATAASTPSLAVAPSSTATSSPATASSPAAASSPATAASPGAAPQWQPTAASALSALAQAEKLAVAQPRATAVPTGVPDLSLPVPLANDLFAPNDASEKTEMTPAAALGPRARLNTSAWTVPEAPAAKGNGKWFALAAALVLLVGGAAVAYLLVPLRSTQVAQKPAPAAPPAPVAALGAKPGTPEANAGKTAAPAAAEAPSAPAPPPARSPAAIGRQARGAPHPPADSEAGSPRGVGRSQPKARPQPKVAKVAAPSGPVKAALDKEDIWSVVRANAAKMAPCLKAARSRNEIAAGSYTFKLDWVITAAGTVAEPHLKGPDTVLAGSLPACFAAAMAQWRFPASQAGVPVHNFPFGPIKLP